MKECHLLVTASLITIKIDFHSTFIIKPDFLSVKEIRFFWGRLHSILCSKPSPGEIMQWQNDKMTILSANCHVSKFKEVRSLSILLCNETISL